METASPPKVAVALNPVPGFCVKSRATNDTLIRLSASDQPPGVHVKQGLKIFVNIAWDSNVPPPPPGSEDVVHRAMQGLHIDESNPDLAWFVPIVLSGARQDSDKGRYYSHAVKIVPTDPLSISHTRSITDSFRQRDSQPSSSIASSTRPLNLAPSETPTSRASSSVFPLPNISFPLSSLSTLELALQRVEAQTTLVLSRQIGIPNIASKGKLQSRRVSVPVALYPNYQASPTLVEEISDRSTSALVKAPPEGVPKITSKTGVPAWSWTQEDSSIRIVFDVPGVVSRFSPPSPRLVSR